MYDFGVFIGRFQPFHHAHLETVRESFEHCKHLIIVIGSDSQARTIKNPWTTDERVQMIHGTIKEYNKNETCACLNGHQRGAKLIPNEITVVAVPDYLYNDNLWITSVQQKIAEIVDDKSKIALIGHKKDASSFYLKMFPQWDFIETNVESSIDATHIRDCIFTGDLASAESQVPRFTWEMCLTNKIYDLRAEYEHVKAYKASWASAPFPPTFVTVDAVVVCTGHVLVVRRKGQPGAGLVALPGGFIKHDELIIDACIRELKEETGIKVPIDKLKSSIVDQRIFDHPNRSLRGRTITHAFCINLGHGELPRVKGMDDADKAWFMPLRTALASEHLFFEDHFHIINYFVNRF